MKLAWVMFPVLLIPAAIASGQNYRVEATKLLEVSGNVRSGSCGGGCCEGHDGTACAGVQVRDEYGTLLKTLIFDNVPCCVEQCHDRQDCGLPIIGHRGPGNSCPDYIGRFSVQISNLDLCVAPGEVFRVPVRQAKLGNVVNNTPSGGSNCSPYDPFEPYPGSDLLSYTTWGGFEDTCPDPQSPDIVCVPSDCTPGDSGRRSRAVPRYTAEIIEPYGNEYYTRWDHPEVWLKWRAIGRARLESYRVVAYGTEGRLIDRMVPCATEECAYQAWFPREPGAYYWWVQPLSATTTGDQSRAGFFNLSRPLTSCNGLGGSCVGSAEPGVPATCADGGILISGALDCPDTCCSGDCTSEQGHDHSGSCGSVDACGHVFGTPYDPGCGTEVPPDTPSCGELGGNYCSTTSTCPWGYASLGTTRQNGAVECQACCQNSLGDGYCEPGIEDCGTSPVDCPCWQPGTVCNASGSPGQCVDRCSDPAFHDHSGSCGQPDECGHPIGDPQECLESCGAMGGDYCGSGGACPPGFDSLGGSNDCDPCCRTAACQSTGCPTGSCGWQTDNCGEQFWCGDCSPSCGAIGGDYCGSGGACPPGYDSLGGSYDCDPCCRTAACQSTGCPPGSCGWQTDNCGEQLWCGDCAPSCGAMGGNYCSQSGSCPGGYDSLGDSSDCSPCCRTAACPSAGCPPGSCGWQTDNCGEQLWCGDCAPSCGAMGGNYCSQSGGCPEGFDSLGPSNDCNPCCVSINAEVDE